MADQADFGVRLRDRVTGPARKVKAALRGIVRAARQAQAATRAATASVIRTPGLARIRNPLGRRRPAVGATRFRDPATGRFARRPQTLGSRIASRFRRPQMDVKPRTLPMRDKRGRFMKMPEPPKPKGIKDWTRSLIKMNAQAGKGITSLGKLWRGFKTTPVGMILSTAVSGMTKFVRAMADAAVGAAKLGFTITAVAGAALAKFTLDMGVVAERSRTAWGIMEKSQKRGEAAWVRTRILARDFGLSLMDTNESMINLRKQGFKFGEAEEIVKMTADMQAVGATADQVKHAVLAITQVKSKGFLFAEELRQQLAETGVPVQGVIEQVAALKGISLAAARAMVQNGQVEADVGIEAVKAAVRVQLGIEKAGDAALKFSKTLPGLIIQAKNVWQQFFADISEKVDMGVVKESVLAIIRGVESIDRNKVAQFTQNVFRAVVGLIELAKEFGEGFGSAFEAALKVVNWDKPSDETRSMVRSLGKLTAVFLQAIPRAVGVAFDAVSGFMRGLGFKDLGPDLASGIDSIDWDALGAKVEAGAEKIGAVLRSMWDEIAGPESMSGVQTIGLRIGKGIISGIVEAIKQFDLMDFMLDQLKESATSGLLAKNLGYGHIVNFVKNRTPEKAKSIGSVDEFERAAAPNRAVRQTGGFLSGIFGSIANAANTAAYHQNFQRQLTMDANRANRIAIGQGFDTATPEGQAQVTKVLQGIRARRREQAESMPQPGDVRPREGVNVKKEQKITLNFNGVNPNDTKAIERLVKKALERANAEEAEDIEESIGAA